MRRKRTKSIKVSAMKTKKHGRMGQIWMTEEFLYRLFPALLNFLAAVLRYFTGP